MIDLLGRSKIRRKIILLFMYNQQKGFYLSEIARLAGTSAGTAQREINRLLAADLIVFNKSGKLGLYSLNKRYALLDEIESIVRKTFGVETELKKALGKIRGIDFAFLFGSYIKGGLKSDSDIDLFVIGEVSEDLIYKAVQKVERIIGREINYHLATREEYAAKHKERHFYREILDGSDFLIGDGDEFRKIIK